MPIEKVWSGQLPCPNTIVLSSNVGVLKSLILKNEVPAKNHRGNIPKEEWLKPDETLSTVIETKEAALKASRKTFFQILPGFETIAREASSEFLEVLSKHLVTCFPSTYQKVGPQIIEIIPSGRRIDLADTKTHPLEIAGLLVADDITISLRNPEGKLVLAAAFVATPSSWDLEEMMGRSIAGIHEGVVGYDENVRGFADAVMERNPLDRIFQRNNGLIYKNPELVMPMATAYKYSHIEINKENIGETLFFRSEIQTVIRLPITQTAIFTIRPFVWPVSFVRMAAPEVGHKISAVLSNPKHRQYSEDWRPLLVDYFQQIQ